MFTKLDMQKPECATPPNHARLYQTENPRI